MTGHSWYKTGLRSRNMAEEPAKVTAEWRCDRCSGRTMLYEGFHPDDQEPGIVAVGADCDAALVKHVLET